MVAQGKSRWRLVTRAGIAARVTGLRIGLRSFVGWLGLAAASGM
jgi:hypothetical protein